MTMKRLGFCFATALVAILSAHPAWAAGEKIYYLNAVKAQGTSVSNSTFDNWIEKGFRIVKQHCSDIDGVRVGSVDTESGLPSNVRTQAEQQKLRQTNRKGVVLLQTLQICGTQTTDWTFAGCELTGGPIVLVNYPTAHLTLIHEIGHRVGRVHTYPTNICKNDQPPGLSVEKFRNFMYCRAHAKRTLLTTQDCAVLKASNKFPEPVTSGVADTLVQPETSEVAEDDEAMAEFKDKILFHFGTPPFPFETIAGLSNKELDLARRILSDQSSSFFLTPAALILGLRGELNDVEDIENLFDSISNRDDPQFDVVRTGLLKAVGYYLSRSEVAEKAEALEFLLRRIDLSFLADRVVKGEIANVAEAALQSVAYSGSLRATRAAIRIALRQTRQRLKSLFEEGLSNRLRKKLKSYLDGDRRLFEDRYIMQVVDVALKVREGGLSAAFERVDLSEMSKSELRARLRERLSRLQELVREEDEPEFVTRVLERFNLDDRSLLDLLRDE